MKTLIEIIDYGLYLTGGLLAISLIILGSLFFVSGIFKLAMYLHLVPQ